MMSLRISLWTFACLALLLSSLGTGHARGHAPAVGQITLCLSGAIVTVAVDAEGRPVEHAPLCPDCIAIGLAGLSLAVPRPPVPRPALKRSTERVLGIGAHPAPRPPVRAPPRFV